MGSRVVVGLSGGVDSSAAAWLLKNAGYEVIGVTVRTWQNEAADLSAEDDSGCGASSMEDARRVAEVLEIPYHVMDFGEEFHRHVIDYFVAEYLRGRTPNPCIACNRYVKWEALLRGGGEFGADYISTGHYARIDRLANGRYAVRGAVTAGKDQTYALYDLTQEQLSHTLFPVGAYTKREIRQMAQEAGIPVADKPDSQEICFVPDGDYAGFIAGRAEDDRRPGEDRETGRPRIAAPGPGNFVTADGEVLGRHKGITHYTVGQRRGLELSMGRRVFVTAIRPETNEVVVGDDADTFTSQVCCDKVNFMAVADLERPMRVRAKIRYNHPGEYGVIEKLPDGGVRCRFDKPVRAAAPGQAMVFYDGEYVLGGGTIV